MRVILLLLIKRRPDDVRVVLHKPGPLFAVSMQLASRGRGSIFGLSSIDEHVHEQRQIPSTELRRRRAGPRLFGCVNFDCRTVVSSILLESGARRFEMKVFTCSLDLNMALS